MKFETSSHRLWQYIPFSVGHDRKFRKNIFFRRRSNKPYHNEANGVASAASEYSDQTGNPTQSDQSLHDVLHKLPKIVMPYLKWAPTTLNSLIAHKVLHGRN